MVRLRTSCVARWWLSTLAPLLLCVWLSAVQADSPVEECLEKRFFWCSHSAKCIDPKKRCNGVPWECPNNEDENDCSKPKTTPPRPPPPPPPSPSTASSQSGGGCYLCGGIAPCISSYLHCDGSSDCPEGDDEINCRSLDDSSSSSEPRPPWMWPVMSTVAGLVGGALLCTATALLVQRCRRVRRQRRERDSVQCEAATAAAEATSNAAHASGNVGRADCPPPYDDALERRLAATYHQIFPFNTDDTPPKYVDIVAVSASAPPPDVGAIYVDPCQAASGGAALGTIVAAPAAERSTPSTT